MHFVEQLKAGVVSGGTEAFDLFQRAGLLTAKVVAGEAQNLKPLSSVAVLQRLQTAVLTSEAAAACHVHD